MTTRIRTAAVSIVLILLVASVVLHAQSTLDSRKPQLVTLSPVRIVPVVAGRSAEVKLNFRVARGYHINSSEPRSELLIPTKLTLKVPNDIFAGGITYPKGEDMTFEFAPDEPLSVYEGPFTITALVRAASAASRGTYRVRGELSYQACDDKACYPPATMPLHFDVRVLRPRR